MRRTDERKENSRVVGTYHHYTEDVAAFAYGPELETLKRPWNQQPTKNLKSYSQAHTKTSITAPCLLYK